MADRSAPDKVSSSVGANPSLDARPEPRTRYAESLVAIEQAFQAALDSPQAGEAAVLARSDATDELLRALWLQTQASPSAQGTGGVLPNGGLALLAIGGYGRRELFPYSDVDLLFLIDSGLPEKLVAEPLRRFTQALWDAGLRVAAVTRTLAECERAEPDNVEFVMAASEARALAGDAGLAQRLRDVVLPGLLVGQRSDIVANLLALNRARHARFGDTLFHLEPNVKDCPGGLRDAHLCRWLEELRAEGHGGARLPSADGAEFSDARAFLVQLRVFLHLRHGRDNNVLDWASQDTAAAVDLAGGRAAEAQPADPAAWMRLYFRHARAIARAAAQATEDAVASESRASSATLANTLRPPALEGVPAPPPVDAESALAAFVSMAATGKPLSRAYEQRLSDALPLLAAGIEDGPALRETLDTILSGPFAGKALRSMHALGILELILPEFHGIDALAVRDAYHRYTVDEHTFVVVDTLAALLPSASGQAQHDPLTARFAALFAELPQRALLLLAALLHDTGKGRALGLGHAAESARLAGGVLRRLELNAYDGEQVLDLVRNHLEMSAALRRDIFATETVRGLAALVGSPHALRMLTLLTYADIAAVHPGALSTWKAENLWLLYIATSNYLERNVEDERVHVDLTARVAEKVNRVRALVDAPDPSPGSPLTLDRFLRGLPRRYLESRSPQQVAEHFGMACRLESSGSALELTLRHGPQLSDLTIVAPDRPGLFAQLAGVLAGWGMNIVTADAFSNSDGLAVDSLRFTDTYRTLELNGSENERLLASVAAVVEGKLAVETLLAGRRRAKAQTPKVVVAPRITFDQDASAHSTILEVVAQDTPGLLRALALSFASCEANIEVALVDTEGEAAIDVFYLTKDGGKLDQDTVENLRSTLFAAIAGHGLPPG